MVCLAHMTNCIAQTEGDFDKDEAGSVAVLELLGRIAME